MYSEAVPKKTGVAYQEYNNPMLMFVYHPLD